MTTINDISNKKIPLQQAFFVLNVKSDWLTIDSTVIGNKKPHLKLNIHSHDFIRITDVFKNGAVGWHMSDLLSVSLTFAGLPPKGIDMIRVDNVVEAQYRKIWQFGSSDPAPVRHTPLLKMVDYFATSVNKTADITLTEYFPEFTANLN